MTELDERLRLLRRRFVQQAAADARAIAGHLDAGRWQAIRDASHSLAGRAGMFGFASLTDAARRLEEAIDAGAEPGQLRRRTEFLIARLGDVDGST